MSALSAEPAGSTGPEQPESPVSGLPAPELVAQIRRGSSRLARRLRLERPADSMSLTKVAVLGHLRRWGAATPGELAAAEHLQPQSLTRAIADLEAEEMLTRQRDERGPAAVRAGDRHRRSARWRWSRRWTRATGGSPRRCAG